MSTSLPPPAPKDSSAKYAVIGLVLLVGASGAIYLGTRPPAPTPPPPPPPRAVVDAAVAPVGPTVGAQITIPVDEPDAEVPAPVDASAPRIRYVYRTLQACPGSVDPARTGAVLTQNYGGLRECYNRALRADPNLRGRVTTEFVIQPGGTVGDLSTSGALARNNDFKRCFQTAISRLRFPAPRGGCAVFQQSFDFTPGS